jgi:hypothetical protein
VNGDQLKAWLDRALARIEESRRSADVQWVVSGHLDEIDPEWPEQVWHAGTAAEVFKIACRFVPAGWTGRLSLAVPLGLTSEIGLRRPRLDKVLVNTQEPPSLYVFDDRFFTAVGNDREEYRCPYNEEPWGIRDLPGVLEFVSSRDLEARSEGWEFTNDLWMHRLSLVT